MTEGFEVDARIGQRARTILIVRQLLRHRLQSRDARVERVRLRSQRGIGARTGDARTHPREKIV